MLKDLIGQLRIIEQRHGGDVPCEIQVIDLQTFERVILDLQSVTQSRDDDGGFLCRLSGSV